MAARDTGRDEAPPHGFVTAWEVADADDVASAEQPDRRSDPPTRSPVADDRYAVPWALPDE